MKQFTMKNGETCIIRRAEKKDAQALLDYLNEVCRETDFLSFGTGEFGLTLEQEEANIEEQNERKNALNIVAEVQGKLIGKMHFTGGSRPRTAHVGDFGISISKAYWGYGIGTALIRYMIDWAKEAGIRKINLAVRTDNAAGIHLYKKMGFKEEGLSEREFLIEGKFYDSILMGLKID